MKLSQLKGFDKDIKGPHSLHTIADEISIIGLYTISGKILILPIRGNGACNITIYKSEFNIKFSGEPTEKDGKTYMKLKSFKFEIEKVKKLYMNLENLFNDQALSDNMNKFLNENWQDILNEVKVNVAKAIGIHIKRIIKGVMEFKPYNELYA